MSIHERIYRRLLWLYPAAFRARYAEPMAQLFADQLRETGPLRLWVRTAGDLVSSAVAEHLRRDRTVAHSAATVPTLSARVLGIAGILAGVVLIVPFLVTIDLAWYPARVVLFNALVIAVALGLYRRQAAASPRLAVAITSLVVLANAVNLVLAVFSWTDVNPIGAQFGFVSFLAGVFLWSAAAAYGAGSLRIGAFERRGAILLVIGALVGMTGLDRFGLTHGAFGAFFDFAAQLGLGLLGRGLDPPRLGARASGVAEGRASGIGLGGVGGVRPACTAKKQPTCRGRFGPLARPHARSACTSRNGGRGASRASWLRTPSVHDGPRTPRARAGRTLPRGVRST